MKKLVIITAIAALAGCGAAILGGPSTQTITHDCPLVPGRRCPTGYDCPSPMNPSGPCEASSGQDIGDPYAGTSGVFAERLRDAGRD
jgi:hypothetical protein